MVVKSQTYYPDHILAYGSGKLVTLLSWVPALFGLTVKGGLLGEDLSTALRPSLKC
jgi:hypothetical protein